MSDNPSALRKLAGWYRKLTDRMEARVLTADRLGMDTDHAKRAATWRIQGPLPAVAPIAARHRRAPSDWPQR